MCRVTTPWVNNPLTCPWQMIKAMFDISFNYIYYLGFMSTTFSYYFPKKWGMVGIPHVVP